MKKWEVFKDGKSLGAMTAKQIRQALREGVIDPFDMVSAEGSTIKSELVEVDEIFNEEAGTNVKETPPSQAPTSEIPSKIINLDHPPPEAHKTRQFPEVPAFPEDSKLGSSSFNRSSKGDSRKIPGGTDKIKVKKFFLIDDKKRVLGPISATEIQSLFQRGIIANSVKVQKVDGTKLVSVRQFIANYSDKRIKALADQAAAAKAGNPSSKVLNELYQNMKSKRMAQKKFPVPLAWGAVIGTIAAVVAYLLLSGDINYSDQGKRRTAKKAAPALSSKQELKKVDKSTAKPPGRALKPAPKPSPRPKIRNIRKKTSRPKSSSRKATSRPPARPLSVPTSSSSLTPTPPEPRPVAPALPSSKSKASPGSKRGTIAAVLDKIGGVVTISSLQYTPEDLEKCPLKCRLKFKDPAGNVLEAVFFKGAYYEALKSNPGNVTITGSSKLEGSTLVILLQDVR